MGLGASATKADAPFVCPAAPLDKVRHLYFNNVFLAFYKQSFAIIPSSTAVGRNSGFGGARYADQDHRCGRHRRGRRRNRRHRQKEEGLSKREQCREGGKIMLTKIIKKLDEIGYIEIVGDEKDRRIRHPADHRLQLRHRKLRPHQGGVLEGRAGDPLHFGLRVPVLPNLPAADHLDLRRRGRAVF